MTKQSHDPHGKRADAGGKKAWHQDWRTWTFVLLMLVAMAAYVFSVDESLGPAATPDQSEEVAAP